MFHMNSFKNFDAQLTTYVSASFVVIATCHLGLKSR